MDRTSLSPGPVGEAGSGGGERRHGRPQRGGGGRGFPCRGGVHPPPGLPPSGRERCPPGPGDLRPPASSSARLRRGHPGPRSAVVRRRRSQRPPRARRPPYSSPAPATRRRIRRSCTSSASSSSSSAADSERARRQAEGGGADGEHGGQSGRRRGAHL